jgi:DNA-binding HxlR family transcriptional regulator
MKMASRPAKHPPLPREHGPADGGAERPESAPLDLDRLIHERMRLGIVSALAVNERLSFNDLKAVLRTTDGNLSVHARKLEEAGYVRCDKSFVGRLPKTEYRLTAAGKLALERYLDHMEAIIHATRAPEPAAPGLAPAASPRPLAPPPPSPPSPRASPAGAGPRVPPGTRDG